MKRAKIILLLAVLFSGIAGAQTDQDNMMSQQEKKLYLIATAHLDTQWRWTIQETIDKFIPATMNDNFALLEKYPNYIFSFEGAYHYMLMKEYYPDLYARVKGYIAEGRWRLGGSWVNAVDVNVPSAESIIRQTLYGNGFYAREFGKTSRDIFLPDCFGFSYSLPTIAAHCGLIGFSTQKLTWGCFIGIPFNIGLWEGVDGSLLISAVNPGAYVSNLSSDLSADSTWIATIDEQGASSGLFAGFKFYGTGDTGGAPTDESVAWLERSLEGEGPLTIYPTGSDQLMRDLTADIDANLAAGLTSELLARPDASHLRKLPSYKGELTMTSHGVGCYTSQAAMKKWNRRNEKLADAAERISVLAHWLGGAPYPGEMLRDAWIRFLWHQFHDDLTGTSIPEAYLFSWNDEVISLNQFAAALTDGAGATARALDTQATGVPVIVYNPLSISREDLVVASVEFSPNPPREVRVYNPAGDEVPSQITSRSGKTIEVTFLAAAPSVGCAVYDVRPAEAPCRLATGLIAKGNGLENDRYWLTIDSGGNIAAIYDKQEQRDLLTAPIRLQLLEDSPQNWAAWELDYDDVMASPRAQVGVGGGRVMTRISEQGPACVSLEIRRPLGESTFTQTITLAAGGAADQIRVKNEVDWRETGTMLKASFPLNVVNEFATYDLGLGTIERGINRPELYEVPGQMWADLTESNQTYGVAILSDSKYGWDRPAEQILRLTLLHTPAVSKGWDWIKDERSQDLGKHSFEYAIYGHMGDWRQGAVPWQAERLNQPMSVFQATPHEGELGKSFSLIDLNAGEGSPPVAVRAIKQADIGDEIIIRLQELAGEQVDGIRLGFPAPIISAREVNGAEEPIGPVGTGSEETGQVAGAELSGGLLDFSLGAYQPRAFAIRLESPPVSLQPPAVSQVELDYNLDGISMDEDRTDGAFDDLGNSLSGDLLPGVMVREGIPFRFGSFAPGDNNVVKCDGQTIELPGGEYSRLYLIAAAVGGNQLGTFTVDSKRTDLWIQDYAEPIGQWDNRLWDGVLHEDPSDILPMYIKPDPVAWAGTHRHSADGENEAHQLTHLFKYRLDLPAGARELVLPDNPAIRILAVTVANNDNDNVKLAHPLFGGGQSSCVRIHAPKNIFLDDIDVSLSSPNPGATIRYTLDGSSPRETSALYTGPLTFTSDLTLKARAYVKGIDNSFVAKATYTKVRPRPAQSASAAVPGLRCSYYEGEWSEVPDFASLVPNNVQRVSTVSIPSFVREINYALTIDGYVDLPADGIYTFHLWSDDGSLLYINEQLAIDNDGLHGKAEMTADIALGKGKHKLGVTFFQAPGDAALELWVEGPGMPLMQIPADLLYSEE